MAAPTTTRPPAGDHDDPFARGDFGDDDVPPPSYEEGSEFGDEPQRRGPSGRTIGWTILAMVLIVISVIVTAEVVTWQNKKHNRQERIDNALRDLNNRAQTENIDGSFTRAYYVSSEMRATFVRADGLKRCNMRVMPPTDKVLRYSAASVPATDASFRMLKDPDAIGCLEATGGGGVGGGG